jgi:type VI protein secretion system component VasK
MNEYPITAALMLIIIVIVLNAWKRDRERWMEHSKDMQDTKDEIHQAATKELSRMNHETIMYMWDLKSALQANGVEIPKAPWDEEERRERDV